MLPDDKVWNSISFFDELFLVQGDPMKTKDLLRAGINTANKVIILAPTLSEISLVTRNKNIDDNSARKLTREEEDLLDAKTIFKYNLISKIGKVIYCVIELINPKNIAFLNNTLRKNNDEYLFIKSHLDISMTPSFASGEVYYSNIMDDLLAQMYYNPNLLDVLKKLIIGEKEDWVKKRDLKHYKSAPSGNLYLIDMPSFQNDEYIINSQLTFGMVFEKLLHTKKIIVLGVYKSYYFEEGPTPEVKTKSPDIKEILNTDSARSSSGLIGEGKINKKRTKTLKNEPNFYYVVTSPDKDFFFKQK